MAVLSVPRPLQDRLGYAATGSWVEMLRQLEEDQEKRREVHRQLIADQMQSHRPGARAVEKRTLPRLPVRGISVPTKEAP